MKLRPSISIVLVTLCLIGCKEDFLLDNSFYITNLVVDGAITNEPGPYKIIITESSPINNYEHKPVEYCTVTISDDEGQSEILNEIEPGVYLTDKDGIQGKVGNSYQLSIETLDGNEYISDFQEMQEPVEIKDIQADAR